MGTPREVSVIERRRLVQMMHAEAGGVTVPQMQNRLWRREGIKATQATLRADYQELGLGVKEKQSASLLEQLGIPRLPTYQQPDKEQWRNIAEWPYAVSDRGRIKRTPNGRIKKPSTVKKENRYGGYLCTTLKNKGKQKMVLVHRQVAAAFLGPCPPGKECNHRDGNKVNNWASNLEWVTRRDNIGHAIRTGLSRRRKTR